MKVGYLGPSGSFTHNVAVKAFPEANRMPFANITEVIKSYEEGFVDYVVNCKDKIIKRYIEVYNEELDWIDYLFSKGSYIGMNAKIAKDYLTHITIKRMKGVGIKVTKEMLHGHWCVVNPIPWVDKYINMDSVEKLSGISVP